MALLSPFFLLLYVYFTEDKVRHVCPTEEVENFSPDYVDAFDKNQIYRVQWPLLPKDGSFGVSVDFYDAKIVCLAESFEDMHHKVVRNKLKMHQNLMSELMRERKLSTQGMKEKEIPSWNNDILTESSGAMDSSNPPTKKLKATLQHWYHFTTCWRDSTVNRTRISENSSDSTAVNNATQLNCSLGGFIENVAKETSLRAGEKTPFKATVADPKNKNTVQNVGRESNQDIVECGECAMLRKKLKQKTKECEQQTVKMNELSKKVISLQEQLLSSDYQTSLELALMISDDIKGKTPLCCSGDEVHIGNGVYVTKDVWEDKLLSTKGTIAVRDLADEVYDLNDLATRSLEGGKCPNPNSTVTIKKVKATPQKVEAILGVYVGKMMAKGITDAETLSLTIKSGRATLAQKFKESYAKWISLKDEDDDGVEAMGSSEKEQSEDGSGEGEENNDDDDDHFMTAKRSLFRKKTDWLEDSD
ncbi:BEN domain-containing protein 5 [Frankliniella fusca]|uniref:BEN domain-containing protein 5 n=1 Tax=Frankliniella fusca TaxID=407009 RepID=A0AAE1LE80_9NEOP|nr:BEN domain-containing protein 5 [Frankliniella fusca]